MIPGTKARNLNQKVSGMFGEGKEGRTHSNGVHGDVVFLAVCDCLQQLWAVVRFSICDNDHHLLSAGTASALERFRPEEQRRRCERTRPDRS